MSPPGRPACMLAKPSQRAPAASEAEGPTGIGAQYITGGRVAGALIGVARVRKAFCGELFMGAAMSYQSPFLRIRYVDGDEQGLTSTKLASILVYTKADSWDPRGWHYNRNVPNPIGTPGFVKGAHKYYTQYNRAQVQLQLTKRSSPTWRLDFENESFTAADDEDTQSPTGSKSARQPLPGAGLPYYGEPPVSRGQADPLRGIAKTRTPASADEACPLPGVPRLGAQHSGSHDLGTCVDHLLPRRHRRGRVRHFEGQPLPPRR